MRLDQKSRAGYAAITLAILMPYLSRLPQGAAWVVQYVPANFMANVFFVGFSAIPGVVLWALIRARSDKWEKPYLCALITMCGVLALLHHDVDLRMDAQAAIALIIIPIEVAMLTTAVFFAIVGIRLVRSRIRNKS